MPEGKIHKKGEKDFSRILKEFKKGLEEGDGAIGSFVGVVREDSKKGGKVRLLRYEKSEEAETNLENIAAEIEKEEKGISNVAIHHIVDDLEPKDDIIYVIVSGKHREEVFKTLPKIMDRVKSEAQIWKKEITDEDDYWVHEVEG